MRYIKNSSVIINQVEDIYIMIEVTMGNILNVNEIVIDIWKTGEDILTVDEATACLLSMYDVEVQELKKDIQTSFDMLVECGFLTVEEEQ